MTVFLKGVEEVQRSSHGDETDSLAVAFLCNSILPGSFTHGRVLGRLAEFYPSALIWYGVLTATSETFDIQNFGSGLIAKLFRDVGQRFSFDERPLCDLSLDEFEVLARATIKTESIKSSQQKTALVALLPGIDVLSRVLPDEELQARGSFVSEQAEQRIEQATKLLDEASFLLRDIGRVQRGGATGSRKRRK
jgi:hypothetical protein